MCCSILYVSTARQRKQRVATMRLHILKHMRAHCWVCACACKHRSSLGTCAKSGTGLVSKSKTLPNWNKIRKARRSRKMMRMKTTTRRCLTVVVFLSFHPSLPSLLPPPTSVSQSLAACVQTREGECECVRVSLCTRKGMCMHVRPKNVPRSEDSQSVRACGWCDFIWRECIK